MKIRIILLFASLLGCVMLHGQSLPSLQVYSDAEAFGRAGVSVASKATAYAWENNASAAAFSDKTIVSGLTYGLWTPFVSGSKILSASFGWKKDILSLGLIAKTFRSPAYELYDENGVGNQVIEHYSPAETMLGIGGAYQFVPGFSFGFVAKIVSSFLAVDTKATVFCADLSASFRKNAWQAGLVLANIGPFIKYSGSDTSYPQPMILNAGVSYEAIHGLHLLAQADWLLAGAFMGGAAVDYWWKDTIGVRVGYHLGSKPLGTASFATIGLGGKYKGIHLDAGWAFLGENHRNTVLVTLGYDF